MIDLAVRNTQEELMDNFKGTVRELEVVLNDITRVNHLLGGNSITVNAVFKLIKENIKESYTILDMGCADGNMLRELAMEARKRDIKVNLIGVDLNADALSLGRAASVDFPEITFYEKDILSADFSDFKCDVVITTLTMHHFSNRAILDFAEQFIRLATIGVVINDLQRSVWAYYLFRVFSLIFIKTNVAKIDGLISISKGFKKLDLKVFAEKLPQVNHQITWKWAFRYVWIMRKNRL